MGLTADPLSDSFIPSPHPRTPRTLIQMEMPPASHMEAENLAGGLMLGGDITASTRRYLCIRVCSSTQAPSLGAASRMWCGLRQNEAEIGPDAQKIAAISSQKGQINK